MSELADDAFARLSQATREADELFQSGKTGGGGTRHWLRECFLPALEAAGLAIVPTDEVTGLRRALVAHHDMATLSDKVLREYDFRECPVCRLARA